MKKKKKKFVENFPNITFVSLYFLFDFKNFIKIEDFKFQE